MSLTAFFPFGKFFIGSEFSASHILFHFKKKLKLILKESSKDAFPDVFKNDFLE